MGAVGCWVLSDLLLKLAHSTQGSLLLYVYWIHAHKHTHTKKSNKKKERPTVNGTQ